MAMITIAVITVVITDVATTDVVITDAVIANAAGSGWERREGRGLRGVRKQGRRK
jgi:hypothetical protein